MKQKVEITLEVEETIILRQGEKILTEFCPLCQASVEMITPPIAAALTGSSEREIFRLIENGRLHFREAERIFVCRNCLTERSAGNSDSFIKTLSALKTENKTSRASEIKLIGKTNQQLKRIKGK
jgi:hypothetical protein